MWYFFFGKYLAWRTYHHHQPYLFCVNYGGGMKYGTPQTRFPPLMPFLLYANCGIAKHVFACQYCSDCFMMQPWTPLFQSLLFWPLFWWLLWVKICDTLSGCWASLMFIFVSLSPNLCIKENWLIQYWCRIFDSTLTSNFCRRLCEKKKMFSYFW